MKKVRAHLKVKEYLKKHNYSFNPAQKRLLRDIDKRLKALEHGKP